MHFYFWFLLVTVTFAQRQLFYKCGLCECEENDRVTVRCISSLIQYVPQDLPVNTSSLHVMGTQIATISSPDFRRYKHLSQITIMKNMELTTLEAGIFSANTHLSNIVIKNNSQLSNIHKLTFSGDYHSIRALDLSYNNLDSMPDLSRLVNFNTTLPYHLILSGNPFKHPTKICPTTNKTDNCKFNNVAITHTQMTYLPNYVLNRTKIGKLDLSNNPLLTGFDRNTFSHLVQGTLEELVLSDNEELTMIPEEGISSVRVLRYANCKKVRKIPPTIVYKNIEEVHLTYPQHCCAFRQPAIQDKEAYTNELEKEKYKCRQQESTASLCSAALNLALSRSSPPTSTTSPPDYQSVSYGFGRRLLQFEEFLSYNFTMFEDMTTTNNPLFEHIKPTIDSRINHVIPYVCNCSTIDFEQLRADFDILRYRLPSSLHSPCCHAASTAHRICTNSSIL